MRNLGSIAGIPFTGKYWFVDPVNGLDGNSGTSPTQALKTLYRAQFLAVAGRNDVVILMGIARQYRHLMADATDTEEKLRAFFPILASMVQQGLVTLSDVDVIKYTHDYESEGRRKEVRP